MLTRWSPFEELNTLQREMDRLFTRALEAPAGNASAFAPAVEVASGKDGWDVRLALPGVDPRDVQVEVAGDTLTVRGERKAGNGRPNPYISEIAYGRFERTLTLPDSIEGEKVGANYRNGMLELHLPLRESVKPRRIQISTEEKPALENVA